MEQQFFRIADELGWDIETQISHLDGFIAAYGAGGRLDAKLAAVGLSLQQPLHRTSLRDALLRFIERLEASGAFSRFLQRELQCARAREAAAATARTDDVSPQPVAPTARPRTLGARLAGWLPQRVRAARQSAVS